MDGSAIRAGFVVLGAVLIVFGFWTHSRKKLAVNYAVIWGLLGACLIAMGLIPMFSQWTNMLGPGTGLAFFCVGVLVLFTEVQETIVISQLNLKNKELAMQVALLNQENEVMKAELERLAEAQGEADANEEKDLICY